MTRIKYLFLFVLVVLTNKVFSQTHFTPVWSSPYQTMNIWLESATYSDNQLSSGDEVAVYDGSLCVGVTKLNGPVLTYVEIKVSADNPITTEVDGFTSGHAITYKLWKASSSTEVSSATSIIYNPASPEPTFSGMATVYVNLQFTGVSPSCYTITPNVNPPGTGNVLVNTSQNCSGGYTNNTQISLTAQANIGYTFSGWSVSSGGSFSSTSSATTTFTITSNASITASFIATSTPTITTSPSSLNFGNQQINTISSSQYYTVSGSNLTSNIIITSQTGFQISLNNSTWQTTPIILNQSGGAVQNTSIYVRFAPTNATSYSGNISHISSGATLQNVAVSGTGTGQTNTYSISGFVYTSNGSGISGVVMNGFPATTSTDANGFYIASVSSGWSGTVTPTKNGYSFSPLNQSYSNINSNQTKDYTGTVQTTTQTIFYGNSALTWTVTAPGTGYVVGTNSYGDIGKYQRFDIIGSKELSQVKIYFAAKQINGAADNFNLVVRSYGTGGAPGTLLYSQSYSTNIIDVTNPGTSYSSFTIDPQTTVNEKFFIGIEWMGSIDDQFAIKADDNGEGESQNRAWEKWSDGTFHDVYTSWGNFDVDLWIASVITVLTDVKKDENVIPSDYVLYQNYPNPFNPTTNIEYSIPHSGFVSIKVYDVLGKEIATLVNEEMQPGNYKVKFDGSKLTSGVYFYQLRAGIFSQIQKFLLIK